MLDKFLLEYVETLYNNQNINMEKGQSNLYSKQQYYEFLKPVVEVLKKYKDYSLAEIRNVLFEKSGIEEKVRNFIFQREIVPGLVFSYGTEKYKETIVVGNKQEVDLDENNNIVPALEKMTEDTIFDLASVTKLFTSLSMLQLVEKGVVNLDDEIIKHAPQFNNLKGITIFDLLSFKVPLKTTARIDAVSSKEESEKLLFGMEVGKQSKRHYTDMGAMVLKYVIENASGMDFYNYIDVNILKKFKMPDTHVVIPKYKLDRVASTNLAGKYYKDGNVVITSDIVKGKVYDEKAQIMGQQIGNLSGHAGLFSTALDMTNLAKGIIDRQVINDYYLDEMAKNRTGKEYFEDGERKYFQYLGFLCYTKHPILETSEIFHAMSGRSFSITGWTGTKFSVDPINNLFLFMGGSKSHNRMVFIDPTQEDKVKVDDKGKRTIVLPNGEEKIISERFAWDKSEAVIYPISKLALQYKMVDDIYKLMNEKLVQDEKTRYV